jgi:hypothetical protein
MDHNNCFHIETMHLSKRSTHPSLWGDQSLAGMIVFCEGVVNEGLET